MLKRFISLLVIFSMLWVDGIRVARAMENKEDNIPRQRSASLPDLFKPQPLENIPVQPIKKGKQKLKPKHLSIDQSQLREVIVPERKVDDSHSGSKKNSSDSNTTSPRKQDTVEDTNRLSTSSSPEKSSASSSENLTTFTEQNTNLLTNNTGNLPKTPLITLELGEKKQQKSPFETLKPQNQSSMFITGNTVYIFDEQEGERNKEEFFQKASNRKKSNSKNNTSSVQKQKLKEEIEIFEVDDENSQKRGTQPSSNKQNAQIELLKESFAKLNKAMEKYLSSTLQESPVSTSSSINIDLESLEKIPLLQDIKKANSNKPNLPLDSLKGILEEDLEKTTQAFEEWCETASDKTLCQQLEVFLEGSVALGPLFAQDLENMLKENPGFKKITVQDWLTHMGLSNNKQSGKFQVLSQELIKFYELFNQALSYHIATTLFKDKIPEEDLEKFKSFLLHLKDYTIDGKLTWKQIVGALVGVGVGGLASFALYLVFGVNLMELLIYYDDNLNNMGSIVNGVAPSVACFIVFDAIVRNARIAIDYFTPDTKRFILSMDPKIAKSLKWKKAGAIGWSIFPSLIPLYYYYSYTFFGHAIGKFWAFGGFLYANTLCDNASRLVSNANKGAQQQSLQKIEDEYPLELQGMRKALLKDLKRSQTYLKKTSQKEINKLYEEVYDPTLSKTDTLSAENLKLTQALHLLMFFLELGSLEGTELTSSLFSVETQSNTKEGGEHIFLEDEENKDHSSLQLIGTEKEKVKKPTTLQKVAYGASVVLPFVGSALLWWGAKYMWGNVIQCPDLEHCWNNELAIGLLSGGLGLLTWGTTSYVQKASIQKNIEDLGTSQSSKITTQKPLRYGWKIWNYILGTGLTIPDFMLWTSATNKWKKLSALKYIGIGCAIAPEVISTADSLNSSSDDFITGFNRVLSLLVYAPEGFRRQKLTEINHELGQFIKTLKPEVSKVFFKILPLLRKTWRDDSEIKQQDLEKLFGSSVMEAFNKYSQNLKQKRKQNKESEKEELMEIN